MSEAETYVRGCYPENLEVHFDGNTWDIYNRDQKVNIGSGFTAPNAWKDAQTKIQNNHTKLRIELLDKVYKLSVDLTHIVSNLRYATYTARYTIDEISGLKVKMNSTTLLLNNTIDTLMSIENWI